MACGCKKRANSSRVAQASVVYGVETPSGMVTFSTLNEARDYSEANGGHVRVISKP